MYSKLLKYDWRATRGMLGLLCVICLGAALAGGGTMRYLIWASDYNRESTLLIVVNVMAMIACLPRRGRERRLWCCCRSRR